MRTIKVVEEILSLSGRRFLLIRAPISNRRIFPYTLCTHTNSTDDIIIVRAVKNYICHVEEYLQDSELAC